MKRRAAESGKLRRPVKRTKITEGVYSSSVLYLKFMSLWAAVVAVDYMLEFRLELLWPLWMMLRSVYDSFKYQGLAFSVFFICIALTSDMICFFFIPVQWIFFAASTYVWVQYVWYTVTCLDKGICLPTVVLCCVLVYIEGSMRGVRERGGGGGLDLCRPFAAHCVGYPVVTLGFGVKSYVSHRMRLRRQREVQAENEFYYQLLRQALPEPVGEQQTTKEDKTAVPNGTAEKSPTEEKQMNGNAVHANTKNKKDSKRSENGSCVHEDKACPKPAQNTNACREKQDVKHSTPNGAAVFSGGGSGIAGGGGGGDDRSEESPENHTPTDKNKGNLKSSNGKDKKEKETSSSTQKEEKRKNKNKEKEKEKEVIENHKTYELAKEQNTKEKESSNTKETANKDKEREKEREKEQRDKACAEETRRTRAELAACRASEAELRKCLATSQAAERARKQEHTQLKHAHAELQIKVNSLARWRATDRATLERRLTEERQRRGSVERQLQAAQRQAKTGDCGGEWCRSRRAAAETETASLRRELQRSRDRIAQLQHDLTTAQAQTGELEARCRATSPCCDNNLQQQQLASALSLLKERAAHLERSLSAETRIKLDLFSALGEAKRQLQIREGLISTQEKEIDEMKAKIAQMLAVMPTESFVTTPTGGVSKLRLPSRLSPESLLNQANSSLDPNATVYTPKNLPCSDA